MSILFSLTLKILILIIFLIEISKGDLYNSIKVKRNDGADIASTLDLAFAPLQKEVEQQPSSPTEERSASLEESEQEEQQLRQRTEENDQQKHEVERMVVLQNLNYLDDVITNLETEKQNLENLWKSSTSDSETSLHRAAKSLWQKTSKQITVLNEKKKELMESLKTLTFGEKLQNFIESENDTSSLKVNEEESTLTPSSSSTDSEDKKESTPTSASSISKAICQFFVFGTLFGVVITITVCTCFLQPRQHRRPRQCRIASISNLNPSRIPEPFDYSKPCFLKADSTGKFYASPIDGSEIPPLPTYEAALALPRSPSSSDGRNNERDINELDSVTVIDSIEVEHHFPKDNQRNSGNSEHF